MQKVEELANIEFVIKESIGRDEYDRLIIDVELFLKALKMSENTILKYQDFVNMYKEQLDEV